MNSENTDGTESGSLESSVGKTLQSCVTNGVLVIDSRNQIIQINSSAAQLLDLGSELRLPLNVQSLPASLQSLILDGGKPGKKVAGRQIVLPRAGQPGRSVLVHLMPMREAGASPCALVVVLVNQEEVQSVELSMRRLDRLASVGTLSASIAHEIKNALVPIKTFLQVLQDQRHSELEKQSEFAELVSKEINRIDSLVSQMLRVSAPARPKVSEVRLHVVLDQSLWLLQHHLDGRSVRVERDYGAADDRILGDAYQLEQAILNVLLNGLEAMNINGVLTIATRLVAAHGGEGSDRFELRVSDTGIGIPPENLPRLFETFFTTKPSGTGLGLAITRRIVMEHKGEIDIESRLHQGTSVRMVLPATIPKS